MRSGGGVEAIVRDVGDAVRGLARRPGFSLAAVTTLALAIGATTAVCSLVYGVLLRPLPAAPLILVPAAVAASLAPAIRAAAVDPARVLRQD